MFIKRAFISFSIVALHSLLWAEYSFAQSSGVSAATSLARAALPRGSVLDFGSAPEVPQGPFSEKLKAAVEKIFIEGISSGGWGIEQNQACLLYTSPSPRDKRQSRMPSSA